MAKILVGTYEDYVVGYRFEQEPKPQLDQAFAVRAHSGSVRCLEASPDGRLAVSVGFDEVINLFDLRKNKLIQVSEGAINCAAFVESTHLICGSEDSNIYIYECKGSKMVQVKTLKGHREAVVDLTVHSSGKVLLSVSKDRTMRTWNLIKGRCAYVTNISMPAHLISWSKTGSEFVIAANNEIYLYNNSGNLEHQVKLDKRVNSIEFMTEAVFVVATDSGNLNWYDLKTGSMMLSNVAHDTRIKGVRYLSKRADAKGTSGSDHETEEEDQDDDHHLATMSSDGVLKVWSVAQPGKEKPLELISESTGARLTCMASTC